MCDTIRKYFTLLLIAFATACGLTSCGDEDELVNKIDFSSPYDLQDNPQNAVDHERYLLYKEYGVPVFFNDTIARVSAGTDRHGTELFRYETIDLNWNFQSHTNRDIKYTFDYVDNEADQLKALDFAKAYLDQAGGKMRPFCMLLVDTLYVRQGNGVSKPRYQSGFRSLVVTRVPGLDPDSMEYTAENIIHDMVLSRVRLAEKTVAQFGEVSGKDKYYGRPWIKEGGNGGLGCTWGVAHKGTWWRPDELWDEGIDSLYLKYSYQTYVNTVEEFEAERANVFSQIGRFGFICGRRESDGRYSHLESPENANTDLEYYVNTMLELGRDRFMERYGSSTLVKKKYEILGNYIEGELGVSLDF